MDVTLKPELEKFVAEKIKAGCFAQPSDVINAALELYWEQEEFTPEQEKYLKREIQKGIEQLDRGEYGSFDAERIIAEGRARRVKAAGNQ
jgi:antitoxin ParD1/3/4